MTDFVQAAIEQQVLQAANEMEAALDSQIHAMDLLDEDGLEQLRQKRVQQLKRFQQKKSAWIANGHGELQDVEEKEFFKCAKAEERLVAHFYRNSEPCKIMDMHLGRLAASHIETKFIRIHAEKSPFLTDRLKIWMLPTLAIVKNGKVTDYVVGFDELGGTPDFPSSALDARLVALGAIHEDQHAKPAPGAGEQSVSGVRSGIYSRQTESDEDSDFD